MAELARVGLTPDWMPGVLPRCVPVETKKNQYGERSITVVVGTERVLHRRRWRSVEVLAGPVTQWPHPEHIASARRGYEDWWQALDWVRDGSKKSMLVDRARAEAMVFRLARQERDVWVTWPARVAALMAAQMAADVEKQSDEPLVIEATTMQRVLEAHVGAQLEAFAEIRVSLAEMVRFV